MAIRFVYFDCMETLIQIDLPSFDTYADFAWQGGADKLNLWDDQEAFRSAWRCERERLNVLDNGFREGTILGRIRDILLARLKEIGHSCPLERIEEKARLIHERYWSNYRSRTYVLAEVRECLDRVAARGLLMGVVSNFMVPGGIEELLELHNLDRYFRQVVVSCQVGWRKPSERIYGTALTLAAVAPAEILFIGDSLEADYKGALAAGMEGLLYDPEGKYPGMMKRISSLRDVDCRLEQLTHRGQTVSASSDG